MRNDDGVLDLDGEDCRSGAAWPVEAERTGSLSGASAALAMRWAALNAAPWVKGEIADTTSIARQDVWRRNIENFIGTVALPVGVAGPVKVNGRAAQGFYPLPLATTEAALVASYHRGTTVINAAGGCRAAVLEERVGRTPGFVFRDLGEAVLFADWVAGRLAEWKAVAATTTRHGALTGVAPRTEGNHVYLDLGFTTGDAAGQNMVTIATAAICKEIVRRTPIVPQRWYVEANLSGDKKASHTALAGCRGRRVAADVTVPAGEVRRRLHVDPAEMVDFWRMAAIGGVLSGTTGIQGHVANGLAALYIATGQDAACVAESAIGVTRMEVSEDGDLYAAVTLPNIMVGTVGGGTGLPSQRACLELMALHGAGRARALAEVSAALCLAGELSIIGALAAGEFATAHERLARGEVRHAG